MLFLLDVVVLLDRLGRVGLPSSIRRRKMVSGMGCACFGRAWLLCRLLLHLLLMVDPEGIDWFPMQNCWPRPVASHRTAWNPLHE